mmetsp:Transcript_5385/g.18000  ORF Transcript_5385/g.18000 Transcript_5385/m.18000 type:complete len:317 (-) Transcript_5385:856-1806(-)
MLPQARVRQGRARLGQELVQSERGVSQGARGAADRRGGVLPRGGPAHVRGEHEQLLQGRALLPPRRGGLQALHGGVRPPRAARGGARQGRHRGRHGGHAARDEPHPRAHAGHDQAPRVQGRPRRRAPEAGGRVPGGRAPGPRVRVHPHPLPRAHPEPLQPPGGAEDARRRSPGLLRLPQGRVAGAPPQLPPRAAAAAQRRRGGGDHAVPPGGEHPEHRPGVAAAADHVAVRAGPEPYAPAQLGGERAPLGAARQWAVQGELEPRALPLQPRCLPGDDGAAGRRGGRVRRGGGSHPGQAQVHRPHPLGGPVRAAEGA